MATETNNSKINEFQSFRDSVLDYVTEIPSQMIKFIGDVEEAPLAAANAGLVKENLSRIFSEMEKGLTSGGRIVQDDVQNALSLMNGVNMASTFKSTATKAISVGKIGGGFLKWLAENFKEIKKIIGELIKIIFGEDSKIYKWWVKLELLIDEIWDLIWKLISPIFGLSRTQFSRELSEAEVNYQNELAANTRLSRAISFDQDDQD